MTGPQHYLAAEEYLAEAYKEGKTIAGMAALRERAKIHATLAQTAATAEAGGLVFQHPNGPSAWARAIEGEVRHEGQGSY